MQKKIIICFSAVIILALTGCATQGVMTLQRLAINQQEIQEDVDTEADFFSKLSDDVKNNRLKSGISRKEILAKYGEPIFARPVNSGTQVKELLLYRHPTEYFSSDLIYLYFDQKQRLYSWEIKTP